MFSRKVLFAGLLMLVVGMSSVALTEANKATTPQQNITETMVVLEGTVTDAVTEEELAGVQIKIVEPDLKTKTDKDGEFYIENLKTKQVYTLKATLEGYEDYEKEIVTNTELMMDQTKKIWEVDIELQPKETSGNK